MNDNEMLPDLSLSLAEGKYLFKLLCEQNEIAEDHPMTIRKKLEDRLYAVLCLEDMASLNPGTGRY